MQHWGDITFLRWELQKGICTICGKRMNLNEKRIELMMIGHHKTNKSKGGDDSLENNESRHTSCERWAHKVSKDGNPSKKQIYHFRRYGE